MKNLIKSIQIIILVSFSLFLSCGQKEKFNQQQNNDENVVEQSVPADTKYEIGLSENSASREIAATTKLKPQFSNFINSGAALTINDDATHKFIRSAQLRFMVKNVSDATYSIENITLENKGFIINSSISSIVNDISTINISSDSAVVEESYNLTSSMVIKVPSFKLDTVLKQIAPLAYKIDYRTVNAEDITIQLMSEQMKRSRMSRKRQRISNAISNTGRNLEDMIEAEEALDNTAEEYNNAKLEEYRIDNEIAYSTITVTLYQETATNEHTIARNVEPVEYQPGIGQRALSAFSNGWLFVCRFTLLLLNIWPLIVMVAVGLILFRKYKNKKVDNK